MALVDIWNFILGDPLKIFLWINAALIIITIIFIKPRKVTSVYLWIAAFLVLPVVFVLIFYVFFGRDYHHRKVFRNKGVIDVHLRNVRDLETDRPAAAVRARHLVLGQDSDGRSLEGMRQPGTTEPLTIAFGR